MQITITSLLLGLAVAGTSAAPGNTLVERQNVPTIPGLVWVQFFAGNDCSGKPVNEKIYNDNGLGICHPEDIPHTYNSWKVWKNDAVHSRMFYKNALNIIITFSNGNS